MNVLIVHNRYKNYGGEDTVVNQEMKGYESLGHKVMLYQESNQNLSLIDILFSFFNPFSAVKFRRVIKRFQPDVIHFHNFIFKISPSVFWVIPEGIKTCLTIHNYRFICPSGTLFFNGKINHESQTISGLTKNIFRGVYQGSVPKTLFLGLIFRIHMAVGTFKRIDRLIFLTPFSKQVHVELTKKKMFEERSTIKANFLADNIVMDEGVQNKKIDIIFIGRFTEEKGIAQVINTLSFFSDLDIHLIGDGPMFEKVRIAVKSFKNVVMHGKLERKHTMQLLQQAKYMIFPSIWYEGMPMTIMEAFSMGVPVIAKDLGAMKSMINHKKTGFLYNNLDELSKIIEHISDADYEKMSNACLSEFTKKYSFSVGRHNLQNLISSINENK